MDRGLYELNCRYGIFPNYKISKQGEVWHLNSNNILLPLKEYYNTDGYPTVGIITPEGKKITAAVHRLVADCFLPNPNNYTDINHKDEDKTNNNITNLEWCTRGYNNAYNDKAVKIGYKLRESNPRKKQINMIQNGVIIHTFNSVMEASRFILGADNNKKRADSNIISGIKKNQKRYGYNWEYANDCDNSISRDNQQPSISLND